MTNKKEDDFLSEIERLQKWIDDLQSGMYINCVYCGHRYGPNTLNKSEAKNMRDALHKHVEECPHHPLFKAKKRIKCLEKRLEKYE